MIFYENCLPADDSHEYGTLFFSKIKKDVTKVVAAAVMIGALKVKLICFLESYYKGTEQQIAYILKAKSNFTL